MRRPSVLLVFLSIYFRSDSVVLGFAPLGSEPVEKCNVYKYECPSHFICEGHNRVNHGHCICDRFYGFYGPTCEELSVGSFILGVSCVLCSILTCKSLYLNLCFAYQLCKRGSLQQDTLSRCLFFNILGTLPVLAWEVGFFVGVTSIDRQMFFHQYIRAPVYTCYIATFVLSTMSISLAWIETVERTRGAPNSYWTYKFVLFGAAMFALLVSLVSFRYSMTDLVGVCQGIAISFSYFQAGRMITEALSVMEENGDVVVYQGCSDVLYNIKRTSKKMMIYSLLFSCSLAIAGFTMTMSRPKHKEQNHLPRYAQGQLCFFVIGLCSYQINITLLDYLKSCAKRQLARPPVNRTSCQSSKDFCAWLCCCPQRMSIYELHERVVELPESSGAPGGLPSSQLEHSNKSSSDDGSKSSKPKKLKSDNVGGMRYLLSFLISNENSDGDIPAEDHINQMMKWSFPQSLAVSGGKRGSEKVEAVPDEMISESSIVSSLTEPSYGSEEGPELGLGTLRRLNHNASPVDFDDGDGFDGEFSEEIMPHAILQQDSQQVHYPNHISSDVSSITSSSSDTPPAVVPRFYSNRVPKLSPLPTSTNLLQLQQPSVLTTSEEPSTVGDASAPDTSMCRFRDRLFTSEEENV